MKTLSLIICVQAFISIYALPKPNDRVKNRNILTGVFIPSDTMNNLQGPTNQNQADSKSQNRPNPGYPRPNKQPSLNHESAITNQQVFTNQPTGSQPLNLQPIVFSQQPLASNQQNQVDPNSGIPQTLVLANQPSGQPIVLVQQPSTQQPNGQANQILYVQQPTQNQQPNGQNNQPILYVQKPSNQQPNGQPSQAIVLVQQPSQNQKPDQLFYLVQQPGQNQQQIIVQPDQQPIYLQQPLYVTQPNGQLN